MLCAELLCACPCMGCVCLHVRVGLCVSTTDLPDTCQHLPADFLTPADRLPRQVPKQKQVWFGGCPFNLPISSAAHYHVQPT